MKLWKLSAESRDGRTSSMRPSVDTLMSISLMEGSAAGTMSLLQRLSRNCKIRRPHGECKTLGDQTGEKLDLPASR